MAHAAIDFAMDDLHSDTSASRFFDFDAFQQDQEIASAHATAFKSSSLPPSPSPHIAEDTTSNLEVRQTYPSHSNRQYQPYLACEQVSHNVDCPVLDLQQLCSSSYTEDCSKESAAYDHCGIEDPIGAARQSYFDNDPLLDPLVKSLVLHDSIDENDRDHFEAMADLARLNGPEKLQVDTTTVRYLAAVAGAGLKDEVGLSAVDARLPPSLRALKMEEPLLSTDPHEDMRDLRERNKIKISTEDIEPFHIDVENDEGLHWSRQSLKLPTTLHRQVVSEKLTVDLGTAKYLKGIYDGPNFDVQAWLDSHRLRQCSRNAWQQPTSPPLLPLSTPCSPEVMEPAAAQLDLASTPQDPGISEAAQLDADLLGCDDAAMEASATEIIQQAECGWTAFNSLSDNTLAKVTLPRRSELKVLRILKHSSPSSFEQSDNHIPKKPRIAQQSEETFVQIPFADSIDSEELWDAADEVMAATCGIDTLVADAVNVELESRSPKNCVAGLKVPVLEPYDGSLLDLWHDYYQEGLGNDKSQRHLLAKIQNDIMRSEKKWTGVSKLERDLTWTPFPSKLAKVSFDDDVVDDDACTKYLEELHLNSKAEIDMRPFIWRPEGLHFLDRNDDDDEPLSPLDWDIEEREQIQTSMEPLQSVYDQTSPGLATCRRIGSKVASSIADRSLADDNTMQKLIQKRRLQLGVKTLQGRSMSSGKIATNSNMFSCNEVQAYGAQSTTGLSNFARLQGWPKADACASSARSESLEAATANPVKELAAKQHDIPVHSISLPAPSLHDPERPFSVIISTKTLQNLPLIRTLTSLLPNLDLIERDYSMTGLSSISTEEVDMILSPATALVTTTLQRLRQRPLPGQPSTSTPPFQTRLHALSARYPLLLIYITPPADNLYLDTNDTSTLNSLATATTSAVQTIYIPSPSPTHLAKWIASAICRHSHSYYPELAPDHSERPSFHLLQDETFYERFLRRAGLNAYAAQLVLARVKEHGAAERERTGLATFIIMSPEERMERFGAILSEEVLHRVNTALEGRWLSASNEQ